MATLPRNHRLHVSITGLQRLSYYHNLKSNFALVIFCFNIGRYSHCSSQTQTFVHLKAGICVCSGSLEGKSPQGLTFECLKS